MFTAGAIVSIVTEQLDLDWGTQPLQNGTQGATSEVTVIICCAGTSRLTVLVIFAVPEMVSSGHFCSVSRSAAGSGCSRRGMLHSLLSEQRSLWSKVKNLSQEKSERQMFRLYQLLAALQCYDPVRIFVHS